MNTVAAQEWTRLARVTRHLASLIASIDLSDLDKALRADIASVPVDLADIADSLDEAAERAKAALLDDTQLPLGGRHGRIADPV